MKQPMAQRTTKKLLPRKEYIHIGRVLRSTPTKKKNSQNRKKLKDIRTLSVSHLTRSLHTVTKSIKINTATYFAKCEVLYIEGLYILYCTQHKTTNLIIFFSSSFAQNTSPHILSFHLSHCFGVGNKNSILYTNVPLHCTSSVAVNVCYKHYAQRTKSHTSQTAHRLPLAELSLVVSPTLHSTAASASVATCCPALTDQAPLAPLAPPATSPRE